MNTSEFMTRIREQCPSFKTIDHALTSASDFDCPAAMIAPTKLTASDARLMGDVVWSQDMAMVYSVFIVLERRQDAGFSSKADDLDGLCAELRQALCGWQINPFHAPLQLASGQLSEYRPGIVAWREDFASNSELRITVNG